MSEEGTTEVRSGSGFPTTHWTTLLNPICKRDKDAEAALSRLLDIYRAPIVHLVRKLSRHIDDVENITHDFIEKLLLRKDIEKADRGKGQFRAYLSTCIRHFVSSYYEAKDAKKRGIDNQATSLENLTVEPGHENDAEREFTRTWWRATIDAALSRVRAEWEAARKAEMFDDLEPLLWGRDKDVSINGLAAKYGITPTAMSLRKRRLSERLATVITEIVGQTVGSAAEVQAELRKFFENP